MQNDVCHVGRSCHVVNLLCGDSEIREVPSVVKRVGVIVG